MKYFIVISLCLVAACSAIPVETVEELLRPLVEKGTITAAQAKEIATAITGELGWDWLKSLGEGAVTLALGYFGIRQWRGSPSNRKGSSPS